MFGPWPAGVRLTAACFWSASLTACCAPSLLTAPPFLPSRRLASECLRYSLDLEDGQGGLAEYFRVDPTLLRVIYVVGSIVSAAFPGLLVYLLLWLLIPEGEDPAGPDA